MKFKLFFMETRPQFLTLSVVLAFLGNTIAWYDPNTNNWPGLNIWHAILAGFGLVLTHAAVNIFNDLFDFKSGVDLKTRRTPFSGGSGMLPTGKMTTAQVLGLGIAIMGVAVIIGIYFTFVAGLWLLPLLLVAALFILLYSPFILKRPWPEWAAGAGLGALPVLGLYFSQTGEYTWLALVAAVPSAFLVHNLLLLNEFPDVEADKVANRRTLPIAIGPRNAAFFYSVVGIAVYVWIGIWAAVQYLPVWTLLAFLTLPLQVKAIKGALHSDDPARLAPGMQANVMTVLLTQILFGIGFILGRVL